MNGNPKISPNFVEIGGLLIFAHFPRHPLSQGVLRSMALSAARLAFGLSSLKEGRGSVEDPSQKRLNKLPVSPKGPIATGLNELLSNISPMTCQLTEFVL